MKKVIYLSFAYFLSLCINTNSLTAQTSSQTSTSARPEVGRVGKAYQGEEGLKVYMIRVGKETENEVLIQLTGIDHEWNNKIFKAKVIDSGTGKDYVIQKDNKDWHLIVNRSKSYSIFIPNQPDSAIYYSEDLSSQMNGEFFLTDYLNQEEKNKEALKSEKKSTKK